METLGWNLLFGPGRAARLRNEGAKLCDESVDGPVVEVQGHKVWIPEGWPWACPETYDEKEFQIPMWTDKWKLWEYTRAFEAREKMLAAKGREAEMRKKLEEARNKLPSLRKVAADAKEVVRLANDSLEKSKEEYNTLKDKVDLLDLMQAQKESIVNLATSRLISYKGVIFQGDSYTVEKDFEMFVENKKKTWTSAPRLKKLEEISQRMGQLDLNRKQTAKWPDYHSEEEWKQMAVAAKQKEKEDEQKVQTAKTNLSAAQSALNNQIELINRVTTTLGEAGRLEREYEEMTRRK